MFYYEVKSEQVTLSEQDSFIISECELNEFDVLVIDSESGFVTCRINRAVEEFEALTKKFKIRKYITKVNVEDYLKQKQLEEFGELILKNIESKVKEIQNIEKLRKYSNNPEVQALLNEYDKLQEVKQNQPSIDEENVI